ncbi:MAG: FtsQ-type POTRA domain-containing protein [Defluviitaleaceae bacterium]|nr:FtsQ-type POTRA domain-containing protein [Defluviitaleaceae bacterium]
MGTISFRFKIALLISATLSSLILFMFSPFFNFTNITVTGNVQIETEEILTRAKLDYSTNFFLFSPNQVRQNIMENHYIDRVMFRRVFPNTLIITIQERFLSGYIKFLEGVYLYIDEQGRVLDVRPYRGEDLPIITGLRFSQFHLGQPLEVDYPDTFNTVVIYAQLLNQHNLVEYVSQMDVSNPSNTRIRIYNIEVQLGDTQNAHEKILTLKEIIQVWSDFRIERGVLSLQEIAHQYIFLRI